MKKSADRHYLLGILMIILAFSYTDRVALGMVLQDIKAELDLSDMQLGLLSGIAFSLFYSVMGIPIARWADRGNRISVISITTAMWSIAVMLSGMATSFIQLLLIRILAAVGEAGCNPPAHSLIADHFSRAERPRATAIYLMGGPLSAITGYFVAGWLNEFYGWRATLILLGLPGLGLAVLAWATLKDPRGTTGKCDVTGTAESSFASETSSSAQPPLKDVLVTLWANDTFRNLLCGIVVVTFFSSALVQWTPAFFIRSYGLQTGELGTWLAAATGLAGLVGLAWGGDLASRYAQNDESLQLKGLAIAFAFCGLTYAFSFLAPNYHLAFGLIALSAVGSGLAGGPLYATIQTLVPTRMRATAIAIVFLFANMIGSGLGPLVVGALSDSLQPSLVGESLRYALVAMCPGYLWAVWHIWGASNSIARNLSAAETHETQPAVADPINMQGSHE